MASNLLPVASCTLGGLVLVKNDESNLAPESANSVSARSHHLRGLTVHYPSIYINIRYTQDFFHPHPGDVT